MNGSRKVSHLRGSPKRCAWLAVAFMSLSAAVVPTAMAGVGLHNFVVAAESPSDHEKTEAGRFLYDPGTRYRGIFELDRLYFRAGESSSWKGSLAPTKLDRVSCPDARQSLNRKGLWQGNLKKDGSCGTTAEPFDWAVGNLLNFQMDSGATEDTER